MQFSMQFKVILTTDRNGVKYAKRVTYVVDSGKISQVYETVNTETHASDILVG